MVSLYGTVRDCTGGVWGCVGYRGVYGTVWDSMG